MNHNDRLLCETFPRITACKFTESKNPLPGQSEVERGERTANQSGEAGLRIEFAVRGSDLCQFT